MTPIEHLAARVETDPLFLAYHLATRPAAELCELLGCSPEVLARVKLCRAPRPDHHAEDLATAEQHFGLRPGALASVVR